MATINTASTQWATRPADQRFTSLPELHNYVDHMRRLSTQHVISNRHLSVAPIEGSSNGLAAVDDDGPMALTHWSFGQLATLASAPAGYLRSIPAPMAADCLNYGINVARDVESVGVLRYEDDSAGSVPELRAATGPNYGRIWNSEITKALMERFGDGVTGDFKIPGEFGKDVPITTRNTTLYASDRDLFVFLADEKHRIEISNRRQGQPGALARGFFVWNSEVGAATLGIATFLFDYVCQNRIVWGSEDYKEIRIRHTSGAPDRFIEQVAPAIERYANSSASNITTAIEAARGERIDSDKLDEFLAKRFTRSETKAIKFAHEAEEGRPIANVWDVVVGATAYARGIEHNDARIVIERQAGALLQEVV